MSAVDVYSGFEERASPVSRPLAFAWADLDVEILTSPAPIEAAWRGLEESGVASAFQSFDYISDWVRTAAADAGEVPLFAVGRRGEDVQFILPLAIRRFGGIKILSWLGRAHANYGMGLFTRLSIEAHEPHSFDTLVTDIAERAGAHLVHFESQPAHWMGVSNPFAVSEASLLTGNDTYIVTLADDFEAQYRRLFSSVSLSKMRRKWRRIQDFGPASFVQPTGHSERASSLHWFIENKGAQLAEAGRGNPFGAKNIRAFYTALSFRASFLIDELVLNGQREAAGLTVRTGRFAYYLNTAYTRSNISKYSPGFHLFHQLVTRLHGAGVRVIDLGPGDVPYKHEWRPEVINLRAATHLVSARALLHYFALRSVVRAKCALKRNPALLDLVHRVVAFRGKKA